MVGALLQMLDWRRKEHDRKVEPYERIVERSNRNGDDLESVAQAQCLYCEFAWSSNTLASYQRLLNYSCIQIRAYIYSLLCPPRSLEATKMSEQQASKVFHQCEQPYLFAKAEGSVYNGNLWHDAIHSGHVLDCLSCIAQQCLTGTFT